MLEILTLIVFAACGWFWFDSMRAREAALDAGRRACHAENALFLDDTVALSRIRLTRDSNGRIQITRNYDFEFSDTGNNRRPGSVSLSGATLVALHLAVPDVSVGQYIESDQRPSAPIDKRWH
jgi:hypothetical protein